MDSDIMSRRKSILIDFWDYDGNMMRPDFIGFVVVSPYELVALATGASEKIPLVKGEAGHKWSGALSVTEFCKV